jgi:hypothetical protein
VYEDKRFRVGTRTVTEKVPVYAGDQERSGWQEPDDVLSPWWFKMKIKETQWEKRQQEIRNDPYPDIDLAIEYLRNHADTYGIVLTNQEINEIFCKAKWEGWEYFTSEEIESIYGKIKAMRKINIATKNKLHDVTSNPGDIYSIPDLDPKLSNVLFPFKIEILNADDIYRTFIDIPVQTINSETFQRIRFRFLGTDPIKVRKNTYVSNSAKKFGNKHYHTMVIEEGNIAYLFLIKFIDNSWQTIPASKIKIHIQ